MSNKLLIVATIIFTIIFIGVLAILNGTTVGGVKEAGLNMSKSMSSDKYSMYVGKKLSAQEVKQIIDKGEVGECFYVYQPYRSSFSGIKVFTWSLGSIGSTTYSAGDSTVYFSLKYNISSGDYSESVSNKRMSTKTSYSKTDSLSSSDKKVFENSNYYVDSVIKYDKNDEVCGLVFRGEKA